MDDRHRDAPQAELDPEFARERVVQNLPDLRAAIEECVAPAPMETRIVAIDGPGGAGKSTLASKLSDMLGNAPIIHTDDFASDEDPINWWPRLIDEVLEPLAANKPARYRRYDWQKRRMGEWQVLNPHNLIILEGVSSSRTAFRPYLAFSIWLETPRDERLRRGLQRDGADAQGQWLEWMAEEDDYIQREQPARHANVVVDGSSSLR